MPFVIGCVMAMAACGSEGTSPTDDGDLRATRPAAFDGEVSSDEAQQSTSIVTADPTAAALLEQFGGVLTDWQPAELEGEARGALAEISFPAEVLIERPPVIRAANRAIDESGRVAANGGDVPDNVDDYELERAELLPERVTRYAVIVDLATMRIIHLAPMPAPPPTASIP